MTVDNKTLLTSLIIGAIGVPALLGYLLHWPGWLWPIIALLLLLVPLQVYSGIRRREQQNQLRQEMPSRPEPVVTVAPPFQREVVTNVALSSATQDYEFLFSATVFWRPVPDANGWRHANPAALAVAAVIERAEAVTVQEPPHRFSVAQYRLNGVLGTVLEDSSHSVEAWAANAQLTLAEDDHQRLRVLSDVRKQEQVWEYERHYERSKRVYFGEDVFKDPGSALVWWLAHTDDVDVKGAMELVGVLAQLSAAANNTDVPDLLPALISLGSAPDPQPDAPVDPTSPEDPGTRAVRDLMTSLGLDDDEQALFVRRVAKAAESVGREAKADEIRQTFDPEPVDESPATGPLTTDWTAEPNGHNGASTGPEPVAWPDGSVPFPAPDPSDLDNQ
jgi:hypothetical protein